MTHPVSIHLKDFDGWERIVLQAVVELEVGTEGGPLVVEGVGTGGRYVTSANCCLRRAEITEERTSVGGWQSVQEHGDCNGAYLQLKKDMKELEHKAKQRDASSAMVFTMSG